MTLAVGIGLFASEMRCRQVPRAIKGKQLFGSARRAGVDDVENRQGKTKRENIKLRKKKKRKSKGFLYFW